jgi:hypothetical protein
MPRRPTTPRDSGKIDIADFDPDALPAPGRP